MDEHQKTTLEAVTLLNYKGERLGAGMQFHADEADVESLVKSGQAKRVETEVTNAAPAQ